MEPLTLVDVVDIVVPVSCGVVSAAASVTSVGSGTVGVGSERLVSNVA